MMTPLKPSSQRFDNIFLNSSNLNQFSLICILAHYYSKSITRLAVYPYRVLTNTTTRRKLKLGCGIKKIL
jgi:hypothetical protein